MVLILLTHQPHAIMLYSVSPIVPAISPIHPRLKQGLGPQHFFAQKNKTCSIKNTSSRWLLNVCFEFHFPQISIVFSPMAPQARFQPQKQGPSPILFECQTPPMDGLQSVSFWLLSGNDWDIISTQKSYSSFYASDSESGVLWVLYNRCLESSCVMMILLMFHLCTM